MSKLQSCSCVLRRVSPAPLGGPALLRLQLGVQLYSLHDGLIQLGSFQASEGMAVHRTAMRHNLTLFTPRAMRHSRGPGLLHDSNCTAEYVSDMK
jgi:hypothetical protein